MHPSTSLRDHPQPTVLRPRSPALSPAEDAISGELLTVEQARHAGNVFVGSIGLPPRCREQHYQDEADRHGYYARRNAARSREGIKHFLLYSFALFVVIPPTLDVITGVVITTKSTKNTKKEFDGLCTVSSAQHDLARSS